MPIHDQGYRRYGGSKAPLGQGWMVIARAGIRAMFAKRAFLGLLLMAWFPFIVRAVQIYAAANLPQAAFLAPSAPQASTSARWLAIVLIAPVVVGIVHPVAGPIAALIVTAVLYSLDQNHPVET